MDGPMRHCGVVSSTFIRWKRKNNDHGWLEEALVINMKEYGYNHRPKENHVSYIQRGTLARDR